MANPYAFAADAVVTVHAAFVVFVGGGQAAILIGWINYWNWTRHLVFRVAHLAAIGWQLLWVVFFVRAGAALFRKRVMKSGPAGSGKARRGLFARLKPNGAGVAAA